jgi:hypothetical protein
MQQQRLIGRVIVIWGRLEGAIQTVIWDFLRIDMEEGRIVTARNDVDANINMLQSLGKRHLPVARQQQFKDLIKKVRDCQEDRNFIAHGQWGTGDPGDEPAAASIRKKTDPEHVLTESFPASRMHQIVRNIQDVLTDLVAIGDEFAASHGKPRTLRRED